MLFVQCVVSDSTCRRSDVTIYEMTERRPLAISGREHDLRECPLLPLKRTFSWPSLTSEIDSIADISYRLARFAEGELLTGGYGIGDLRSVMRARFGERVRLRPVGAQRPFWRRRFGLAERSSGGFDFAYTENLAADVLAAIEERLIWNRFGL